MAAFKPHDFEVLLLEVTAQFAWAAEEGERNPESVALFASGKLIGGHSRTMNLRTTAIVHAQHYFEDQFHQAASNGLILPNTILMKTQIRQDGITPRLPSPALLRDLRAIANGKQVEIIVLGPPEHKGLTVKLNNPTPAPENL